jgi:carbon starvation protein
VPAIVVAVVVLAIFALGYRYYSRYLADRVYGLDPAFVTPAHQFADGVDYVPTNKHVLFGHHFTSVAGAAPIVGPAIAVFWGWGPALAWIVLGTVFAAGVHDFGSIAVSVRHKARSIGTLAHDVISARARTLFLLIIFFLLTLVNAVFAVVIGGLLVIAGVLFLTGGIQTTAYWLLETFPALGQLG